MVTIFKKVSCDIFIYNVGKLKQLAKLFFFVIERNFKRPKKDVFGTERIFTHFGTDWLK